MHFQSLLLSSVICGVSKWESDHTAKFQSLQLVDYLWHLWLLIAKEMYHSPSPLTIHSSSTHAHTHAPSSSWWWPIPYRDDCRTVASLYLLYTQEWWVRRASRRAGSQIMVAEFEDPGWWLFSFHFTALRHRNSVFNGYSMIIFVPLTVVCGYNESFANVMSWQIVFVYYCT